MLKDTNQMTMDLSPYQGLYEAIIPHVFGKMEIEQKGAKM